MGPGSRSLESPPIPSRDGTWLPRASALGGTGADALQTPAPLLSAQVSALKCLLEPALHVASEATTRLKCGVCCKAHKGSRRSNAPTLPGLPESLPGCGRQSLAGLDVAGEQRPRAAHTWALVSQVLVSSGQGVSSRNSGRHRSWVWGRGGRVGTFPEGHDPQSRMRDIVMLLLSSATMASSSSWDSFRRCWIPAPTGSMSLSDSLGEQRGSVE